MATMVLGNISDVAAVSALRECLEDENAEMRANAAAALVRTREPTEKLVPVLVECLSSDDSGARTVAALALRDIGDVSATPALIGCLGDTEPLVRCYAAEALGEIGDPSALPALEKLLADESDTWVRETTEDAIATIRAAQGN
jgi:HEAT repeat protein